MCQTCCEKKAFKGLNDFAGKFVNNSEELFPFLISVKQFSE
jgi:hypothetical protein